MLLSVVLFSFFQKDVLINGEESGGGWMEDGGMMHGQKNKFMQGSHSRHFLHSDPPSPHLLPVPVTRTAAPWLTSLTCTLFGSVVSETGLLSALQLS